MVMYLLPFFFGQQTMGRDSAIVWSSYKDYFIQPNHFLRAMLPFRHYINTHIIFVFSDSVPILYIHGHIVLSNVICIFIYTHMPGFQVQ